MTWSAKYGVKDFSDKFMYFIIGEKPDRDQKRGILLTQRRWRSERDTDKAHAGNVCCPSLPN